MNKAAHSTHPAQRRGLMLVLSSPSGAGKSTLSKMLLETDRDIDLSVSCTTRQKRPSEVDGKDYHFLDQDAFDKMIREGAFLEHAMVFDHSYGTPKEPVMDRLSKGKDVLFDIDWQGTQQLHEQARDDLVRIFILPPSMDELQRRLKSRAQDSDDVVARRMARAADEISHWAEYDYVLINDDLDKCLEQIRNILAAERLRRSRQPGFGTFVRDLTRNSNKGA